MPNYKAAFESASLDLSAIMSLLGFTSYPGVDPMLRAITDLVLAKAEAQALREEVAAANDRADTLEHRMMGMMTRHFADAWRKRDTEKVLDGYLSAGIVELERERDAALAEVAALRARVVVPDGYALVPVELTGDMWVAVNKEDDRAYAGACDHGAQFDWLWEAAIEAAPRLNGLTVSASALDTLRRFATGEVGHLNSGHCPDDLEGRSARDPNCSVCRALIDTEKSK